jgi:hypothetical protein
MLLLCVVLNSNRWLPDPLHRNAESQPDSLMEAVSRWYRAIRA